MNTKIYQATIISFLMPVVSSLFAIYMPGVEPTFNLLIIIIFAANIVSYLAMLAIFPKRKRQNAARLTIAINMLMFCLFFTFPMLKALMGTLWLQFLLIVIFLLLLVLAVKDQKKDIPLVFPGDKKEHRKLAFLFYAIPVMIILLGGGGNIIIVRELTNFIGDGFVTYWGGALLYCLGCWLAFFFQSLFYKGFIKDGVLVK